MNKKAGVLVKNAIIPYNSEPFTAITKELKDNDIDLFFIEERSIQNSFLVGVEIILSSHLFSMIAQGVIYPATYDLLKSSIIRVKSAVHSKDSIQNNTDILIKTTTDHGEIILRLNKFSKKDVSDYIETMIDARTKHNDDSADSKYVIIEENSHAELEIMTLNEFLIKNGKLKK